MSEILTVEELNAYYGESQILFDVSLSIEENGVVGVFGRNGMGKTTLLESIINRIDRKTGTVRYRGREITTMPPHEIVRQKIAYVPENREIYTALTVRENLELAAPKDPNDVKAERIAEVFDRFDRLAERESQRGGTLSGGEQQMLAIGRALVGGPELLLLDEPTEGLAPLIVEEVIEVLNELVTENRAVLLVEQNVSRTLSLIDRGYILESGRIVAEGDTEYLSDESLHEEYLTV